MKLVHPDYGFHLVFEEGNAIELVIEHPRTFTKFINELLFQIEGEDGRFVLSDEYDIVEIGDRLECIINPFDLDSNKKKIINKLYGVLKQEILMSEIMVDLGEGYANLIKIVDKLQDVVDYPLTYKYDIDPTNFLKFMDVKIETEEGTILERLIDYTRILHQLMKYDIIILVNIQSYISYEELEELLKYSYYEKIHFLLIENIDRGISRNNIKKVIIDKDLCEIY